MIRVAVSEAGRGPLPPVDVADAEIVIGSGAAARIRLPAVAAAEVHVRVRGGAWEAVAALRVDGVARAAGERGDVGAGVEFELGEYRVRVGAAPAGAVAATAQRTESLARELVRSLLGTDAAASLVMVRGPAAGAVRALAPPESALVVGRGDEAGWVILDEDLSRAHARIASGWDGVTIADLASKNGTRVRGKQIGAAPRALRDGDEIELGNVMLRFRDPADLHLRGEAAAAAAVARERGPARARRSYDDSPLDSPRWPMVLAFVIAVAACATLAWFLAS